MKNLVVLSGAGMSAESGISTFRDAGGLWDKYPVEQVATPAVQPGVFRGRLSGTARLASALVQADPGTRISSRTCWGAS